MSLVAMVEDVVVVWVPPGRAPRAASFTVDDVWPHGFDVSKVNGVEVHQGEAPPPRLLEAIERGDTFAAHNAAGFDADAYERLIGGPQPAAWFDTLPCARAAGLPGGLDKLGRRFTGRGKDEAGQRALKLLYTAKVKGGEIVYPVGTVPLWRNVLRYNVADVLLLRRIFDAVEPYGEPDVLNAHHAINSRGIGVDRVFLAVLQELWTQAKAAAYDRVSELTGGKLTEANLRSQPQVTRWLKSLGFNLASLNRQQLAAFYENPEEFFEGVDYVEETPATVEELAAREFVPVDHLRRAAAAEKRTLDVTSSEIDRCCREARELFYGLTGRRFNVRAYADWTTAPKFDILAREMAGRYPELLGAHGFEQEANYNPLKTDAAERLWGYLTGGRAPRADVEGVKRDVLQRALDSRPAPVPMEAVPRAIEVLKARQAVTRGAPGKIQRAFELLDDDGRIRDLLVYFGAHTGRWSGRKLQPHNLPRGVKIDVEAVLTNPTLETVRAAAPGACLDDALASLMRPVFAAAPGNRLQIVDYAAIEARGIAWVAGQADLLDTFRRGEDVYCKMASVIFGRPITKKDAAERQIGKVVVLGCGYGMSARKFAAYCAAQRIDLLTAGVTGESCVRAYRETNRAIVDIWRSYNAAVMNAVKYNAVDAVGRCRFYMLADALCIELPSGRQLLYRDVRIENRVPAYCALLGIPAEAKPTVCYTKPHGHEGTLYGGLIAENIVQAVCRDLLATALVRCEVEGLPVVLHVHDEIVTEGADLDRLASIMVDVPPWAAGFPVAVEGFECSHYTKSPFRGSKHVQRSSAS